MAPFVTRLSEDASEVGSATDERWATDSDYGLSERQLQEAAANKRSVGAIENSKQTGTAPKSDSFWSSLLAGLPFLSDITACTSPCFVENDCKYRGDLSRIPSQDNAQCVACAEEVINGSASPSMPGRTPSMHFATLIVERDSDGNRVHPKGEPSTFYIGEDEDVEIYSSDPTMLGMAVQSLDEVHDSATLGMFTKSRDGVRNSIAVSPIRKDSKAQLAKSRETAKLEAESEDKVSISIAVSPIRKDSKAQLARRREVDKLEAKNEDAVHDSVAPPLRQNDLRARLFLERDKLEAKSRDLVHDSVAPSLEQMDSKAGVAMSRETEKLGVTSKSRDVACDSVAPSCNNKDLESLQDTGVVQMDTYHNREQDDAEPEPESEDWVE
eukprot:TRINITY_DN2680_c0_g1_i1.p1 TRINITY_DN2680_c0_g1~~TRINITY_DN2680_c0_g1_i1.p1  ORF type:complete len:383 (-),score=69.03 TRINITY_DN2680_c0_g1_i1:46-1194(-)